MRYCCGVSPVSTKERTGEQVQGLCTQSGSGWGSWRIRPMCWGRTWVRHWGPSQELFLCICKCLPARLQAALGQGLCGFSLGPQWVQQMLNEWSKGEKTDIIASSVCLRSSLGNTNPDRTEHVKLESRECSQHKQYIQSVPSDVWRDSGHVCDVEWEWY